MIKNIRPINDKGQRHGYWEIYRHNGKLMFKSFYHNDKVVGYVEIYSYIGKLIKKKYHL